MLPDLPAFPALGTFTALRREITIITMKYPVTIIIFCTIITIVVVVVVVVVVVYPILLAFLTSNLLLSSSNRSTIRDIARNPEIFIDLADDPVETSPLPLKFPRLTVHSPRLTTE
jgi:hypothetical protein